MSRVLPLALGTLLAALALASATAVAATPVPLIADAGAQQVTALDGTLVWVTRGSAGGQALMQRDAAGERPVEGAPRASFYRSIDLGRDRLGHLVLTYLRCASPSRCVARRDDLRGRRAGFGHLALHGCSATTAPALWRSRAAYGLRCRRGKLSDPKRSGLYVKTSSGTPKRLPPPKDAARFDVSDVSSVDLRGTRAAAILSDVYSYAVSEDVDGTDIRSALVAASEGDSDEQAVGLELGPGGILWSLTEAEHAGDPLRAVINRLSGSCRQYEALVGQPQEERFPAVDLAVDGGTVYLVTDGSGIATHAFAPDRPCP